MHEDSGSVSLAVEYFDGHQARAQPVRLRLAGRRLHIEGEGVSREVDIGRIDWPERQRHGPRVAHLQEGGALHCADSAAWDRFVRRLPRRESWVVRVQQSWRATAAAALALIAVAVGGYLWGVPALARGVLALLPSSVDAAVGDVALQSIEGRWLAPSRLALTDRARIAAAFERAVATAFPDGSTRPAYTLRFHASSIGPNAFALPGGSIVLTDELVQLVAGRDDVLVGVLAHELGHVRQRHGMKMLVQVSLLGAATGIALGDFSAVLAGAPALLGQMAYSRDAEREADRESLHLLRANGLPPAVMVVFFEQARTWRDSEAGRKKGANFDPGIALASHPADEERIAFFRDAAQR